MCLRPNADCTQVWCLKRQAEYQRFLASQPAAVAEAPEQPATEEDLHPDNEWGIEVEEDEDGAAVSASAPPKPPVQPLGDDFKYAHEAAEKREIKEDEAVQDSGADLAELMSQLKAVQK